jgi:hypothetical protein
VEQSCDLFSIKNGNLCKNGPTGGVKSGPYSIFFRRVSIGTNTKILRPLALRVNMFFQISNEDSGALRTIFFSFIKSPKIKNLHFFSSFLTLKVASKNQKSERSRRKDYLEFVTHGHLASGRFPIPAKVPKFECTA